MRPYKIFYLPDMKNDWHWFVYDTLDNLIASSSRGYFHLVDAQREAEAVMLFSKIG